MRYLYTRHRPFGPRVSMTRMSGLFTLRRVATYTFWMGPSQTTMSVNTLDADGHNTSQITILSTLPCRRSYSTSRGSGLSSAQQGTASTPDGG